jgi:hypothetical protein
MQDKYSSITLVDPFYGGSSCTTKFEIESFETQFCFSNSPDVVPIASISVGKIQKKFKGEKHLEKFAFFCHFWVVFHQYFANISGSIGLFLKP